MSDEAVQADQKRTGRPPLETDDRTRRQVRTLAGLGLSVEDIGRVIEISEGSVRNHYLADLEIGRAQAKAKVAGSLFKMATDESKPNVVAAIFWLKNRAGWKDVTQQDLSLSGGIDAPPRPANLEDAEAWLARRRRELAALTEHAKPKPPVVDVVAVEQPNPEPPPAPSTAPPAPLQPSVVWTLEQERAWQRREM